VKGQREPNTAYQGFREHDIQSQVYIVRLVGN